METKSFRLIAIAGAVLGGFSVASGAFGAHMLVDILTPEQQVTFQTAVRYQFWHALALLVVCLAGPKSRLALTAGLLMLVGSILFSGSLFILVLAEARWAGPITPLGGFAMIAGWATLALSLRRLGRPAQSSLTSSTSKSRETLG